MKQYFAGKVFEMFLCRSSLLTVKSMFPESTKGTPFQNKLSRNTHFSLYPFTWTFCCDRRQELLPEPIGYRLRPVVPLRWLSRFSNVQHHVCTKYVSYTFSRVLWVLWIAALSINSVLGLFGGQTCCYADVVAWNILELFCEICHERVGRTIFQLALNTSVNQAHIWAHVRITQQAPSIKHHTHTVQTCAKTDK